MDEEFFDKVMNELSHYTATFECIFSEAIDNEDIGNLDNDLDKAFEDIRKIAKKIKHKLK